MSPANKKRKLETSVADGTSQSKSGSPAEKAKSKTPNKDKYFHHLESVIARQKYDGCMMITGIEVQNE